MDLVWLSIERDSRHTFRLRHCRDVAEPLPAIRDVGLKEFANHSLKGLVDRWRLVIARAQLLKVTPLSYLEEYL